MSLPADGTTPPGPLAPAKAEANAPAIPLARWADRQLEALARDHGLPRLDGATLLGERGANNGYRVGGRISAGLGGSRLLPTRDKRWFALTLIRDADREMLPALFLEAAFPIYDDAAIAAGVLQHDGADLLERGRALGLPVAAADEMPVSAPVEIIERGERRTRPKGHRPLVVDMSAIWAGPLAGHLLWHAGMEVVKVESPGRPDLIRADDPATFDIINQGKASLTADLTDGDQRARLIRLIKRADVVIESSRPRALRHLGIDADSLVRSVPGLVWLTVTGHGARGDAANWAGIGNDCGVAGGLSRALYEITGEIGYLGDAIADPLTGIVGAREVLRALKHGEARRIGLSMSAIAALALAEERAFSRETLECELRAWRKAEGSPFPAVRRRPLTVPVQPLGADSDRYFAEPLPC